MKRGTFAHPKLTHLARLLGIPKAHAAGLLEWLWHHTANSHPRGNIGAWTNTQIAMALEWEGDADVLVDSLIQADWLEKDQEHRLLVHDWQEHADYTVRRALERKGQTFIGNGAPKAHSGAPKSDPPSLASAKPSLKPVFPPTPHSQNGDQTKPKFDPAEVVNTAKAKQQALDKSGDTPLVHELGQLLGNDKIDHATWCKLDKLAIGQRCIRGTRETVTALLVQIAKMAVADGAEKPAAAFMHTMLTRYPKLAESWKQ